MAKRIKQENRRKSDRLFNSLIIIGLSGLLTLILVGVFGNAGGAVRDFLIGIFGYAIYGYCFATLVVGILMLLGWKNKSSKKEICLYLLALMVVVSLCHLGMARSLTGLSYGQYLLACFKNHNTIGGAICGLYLYFMSKAFVTSMVILSLLLLGIFALIIVINVNFDREGQSSHKKTACKVVKTPKLVEKSQNQKYNQNQNIEDERPAPTLVNTNTKGKAFPDNIGRTLTNKPKDYLPIEDEIFDEQPMFDNDEVDNQQLLINPNEVKDNSELIRQRALKDLYSYGEGENFRANTRVGGQVDATNTLNHLHKNKPIDNSDIADIIKDEPKVDEPIAPTQPIELDDKYKAYSSNSRMSQLMKNFKRDNQSISNDNDKNDNIESSGSDKFVDDIEQALNNHFGNNFGKISSNFDEPSIADSENIIDEVDGKIVDDSAKNNDKQPIDLTSHNPEPMESMEDLLNARAEEKRAREREEANKNSSNVDKNGRYSKIDLGGSSFKNQNSTSDNNISKKIYPNNNFSINRNLQNNDNISSDKRNLPEAEAIIKKETPKMTPYVPPDISCMNDYREDVEDNQDIQAKVEILESKMADFNIDVKVVNIVKGPTFTRIEFETSTQVNKITAKANDIAMWLEVESLRLEAPIPGKKYCGVEIPNKARGKVGLKSIINSPEFNNTKKNSLCFALGKDIDGKCYVGNIREFPHGLIAGASGSGKSVCLHAMIASMLYKYSPADLRLLLADPKIVELNLYSGIPHLLTHTIMTEAQQVINSLQWAVKEMERRYLVLKEYGVANIAQYNDERPKGTEKIPFIVIVIDEVGDIILSPVGKTFETLIQKLAAKARAAEIHLILATQRPSVDVITGTIKANFPTRIALGVANGHDSQTILGGFGAEKLLGYGDMLYKESTKPNPMRLQGAFISNSEVKNIVKQVKERNSTYFDDDVENLIFKVEEPVEKSLDKTKVSIFPDELCLDVLEFCLTEKELSISRLQRNFAIGFQRAGKIKDWLQKEGFIKIDGKNWLFMLTPEDIEQLKEQEFKGDGDN